MTDKHHKDVANATATRGCAGYEENLVRNWNGNVEFGCSPTAAAVPGSVEELRRVVRDAAPPVRVVGRGHSFTPLAECSGGTLISLARLSRVIDFVPPSPVTDGDCEQRSIGSVTVEGGITYTEIARFLGRRGALRNLPSCPQFTVAGAVGTATHGSGVDIQNLSSQVSMMEFVKADGTLVRYSLDDDDGGGGSSRDILTGCRVHLGCLGVVSRLSLEVVPYFDVESVRYDDVPLENVVGRLPELWRKCDSLSVWTSGFGRGHGAGTCWMTFRHFVETGFSAAADATKKKEEEEEAAEKKSKRAAKSMHEPLSKEVLGENGRVRRGPIERYCSGEDDPRDFVPTGRGPWYDALTLTLRDGEETPMTTVDLQAEFFVPLHRAAEAVRAVWDVSRNWTFSSPWGYDRGPTRKGVVDAMEFRQVKGGDGSWLSPHRLDSLGIHVSFNGDPAIRDEVIETYLPALEEALVPFGARAHWGKLAPKTFDTARVEELYGKGLRLFRDLCRVHDPAGKFRNEHVDRMLFNREGLLPRSKV